jgi:outer membrane protein assembly factor BamB
MSTLSTTDHFTTSAVALSPDGSMVYLARGGTNHILYAVHTDTGLLAWTMNAQAAVVAPPTVGPDGRVFISGGSVFAVDGYDGSVLWSFSDYNSTGTPTWSPTALDV